MILYLSAGLGAEKRHGGVKRSEQILELLQGHGVQTVSFLIGVKSCLYNALTNPLIFLEVVMFSFYLFISKGLSLIGIVKFSLKGMHVVKALKEKNYNFVLLETVGNISIPMMYYLSWKKIKYSVCPQNIEHMVPGQAVEIFRDSSFLYKAEIEGLSKALSVYVISDFDRAILACHGIESIVLPFFPPLKDVDWFNEVNMTRKAVTSKKGFLLLATVGNQPSFNGIKTLITDYQSASPLFLAGYGTDVFSESCSSNVSVLGEVSDEKLFELMASVKALIINQPQTTGFLTKIIESNLAGLPVIVVSKYVQAEKLEEYGIFIGNIDTLDTWECVDPVFGFKKFSMPYDSLFRELR